MAAKCHAPWLLIEAGLVRDLRATSWPSLATDIRNAGGEWVDQAVVSDDGIITSRGPSDLPAFCDAILEALLQRATGPPAPSEPYAAFDTLGAERLAPEPPALDQSLHTLQGFMSAGQPRNNQTLGSALLLDDSRLFASPAYPKPSQPVVRPPGTQSR